jgi:SAM-dependent methyltransferase
LCDEYERVLTECIRVLKPGGYLEFMLFDSDIINAGPLASEMCLRFSISLEGKGRDPEPTRRWISRLYNAGFTDVQRSWLFLPLAPPELKPKVPSKDYDDTPPPSAVHDSQDLEKIKESVRMRMRAWGDVGVEKGTVSDVAAVAGVLSGGSWEKWLAVAGLGDDEAEVGNIIEEAKSMGSGLRCLVGWARKPASPV